MPLTLNSKILLVAIVLAASAFVPVQAQTSPNTEAPLDGTISGSAVSETGQTLAGVTVFIRDSGANGIARTTITGPDGNFRLKGLAPGLYLVSGFLPAYVTTPTDPNSPETRYRIGDTVRLELIRGGVITGTVVNAAGEPIIGVRVRASMVRDPKNQTPLFYASSEQTTDDRGIYRIYGLAPGTYIVSAGGGTAQAFQVSAFSSDVPTYAPSNTRDNALEINVLSGEEYTADIRYRGERGHAISGTVKLTTTSGSSVSVLLPGTFIPIASTFQPPSTRGFAFHGMADGEYDLVGHEVQQAPGSQNPEILISDRYRVVVKGADVAGIELVPKPLSSMTGRIVLEPSKETACQGKRRPLFAETFVAMQRPEKEKEKDTLSYMRVLSGSGSPNEKGDFFIRNLPPGRYLLDPHFFARYWYVDSISLSGTPKIDAAANWTTLKSGAHPGTFTITLAEGAASIRGRVATSEGAEVPAGLGIYLVPAEREKALDVLRYFVTTIAADGTFAFNNLPPGRYLSLQQTLESETSTAAKLRLPESAEARTKLRRKAETQKSELQLTPCQNLTDYQLSIK